MFHEFEIIIWYCFCSADVLRELLLDAKTSDGEIDV